MQPVISVIIPTSRATPTLTRCLSALAVQQFDLRQVEVCVATNGGAKTALRPDQWPFRLRQVHLEAASAAGARNRGLSCTTGELVLFLNDDVEPSPTCLAAHERAHRALERPGMVLGSAAWAAAADETLLDRLVADTSLIMFYDQMRPHAWYGFRHAWTLNLSVAREYCERERFDERISPVNFEDVEWAHRLERRCGLRVWHAPEAACVHHHRYTLEGCLARERQVGGMAVKLWQCNPECFRAIFGADLDDEYAAFCRHAVRTEEPRAAELMPLLQRYAETPAAALAEAPGGAVLFMKLVYHALQPMRRLRFRQGLLGALTAGGESGGDTAASGSSTSACCGRRSAARGHACADPAGG